MEIGKFTAEYVLSKALRQYASIFPTRRHALRHMFWLGGNGMRWHKGQLVPSDDEPDEVVFARHAAQDAALAERSQHASTRETTPEERAWMDDFIAKLQADAERRRTDPAYDAREIARHADWEARRLARSDEEYQLAAGLCMVWSDEYLRVATIPDDAHEDWRALAIESCEMVLAIPDDFVEVLMPNEVGTRAPATPAFVKGQAQKHLSRIRSMK